MKPGWHFSSLWKLDYLDSLDTLLLSYQLDCRCRWNGVQIQNADRLAAGGIARSSYGHLGNIDVLGTKDSSDRPNDAGNIVVTEDEHYTIEVGLQAVIPDTD